jgi:anti-anti-sigma factor
VHHPVTVGCLQTRGIASNEGSIVMAQSDDPRSEQEPGGVDDLAEAGLLTETASGAPEDGGGSRPQVTLEYDEQATRVWLSGEVDLAACADLDAAAAQATALGRPVVVDVSRATFMDSIGVGFIARLIVAGQRAGWRPTVIGAQGPVLETLTVSGILAEINRTPS